VSSLCAVVEVVKDMKQQFEKKVCSQCAYVWTPKVECPLKCPRCGSRAWMQQQQKQTSEKVME